MNRTGLLGALIAAPLCFQFAQAESPEPDEHRIEVLATMLAAYVSCDSRAALKRDVKVEIADFGASIDEATLALATVSEDMRACRSLRKYAVSLTEMAEISEDKFAETLGFPEQTVIEDVEAPIEDDIILQNIVSLSMVDIPLPPPNSNRHVGSDY